MGKGVHRSRTGPARLDRGPKMCQILDRSLDRSGVGPGPDRTGQKPDRTESRPVLRQHCTKIPRLFITKHSIDPILRCEILVDLTIFLSKSCKFDKIDRKGCCIECKMNSKDSQNTSSSRLFQQHIQLIKTQKMRQRLRGTRRETSTDSSSHQPTGRRLKSEDRHK